MAAKDTISTEVKTKIMSAPDIPSGGVPVLPPSLTQVAPKEVQERVLIERHTSGPRLVAGGRRSGNCITYREGNYCRINRVTLPKVTGFYE